MDLKAILDAIQKAKKAQRTTSKVEAVPGSDAGHFSGGDQAALRSPEFNAAAQGLLQDPAGQSIPAKHLGLQEPEGPRHTGPGYWQDNYGTYENPTTEYPTEGADPELARLKAHYEQAVMAQDGVANTTLKPGAPGQGDFMSLLMPQGTPPDQARKALAGAGLGFDDDYFLSPGQEGLHIGGAPWSGMDQQQIQQKAMGALPGAQQMHRADTGANAYIGSDGGGSYQSVKKEMGNLLDDFSGAGKTPQLNQMLRETAGQAPGAYEQMKGISGASPRVDFDIIWDAINKDQATDPAQTIQKLIDDNVISFQQGQQFLQQLQPEGLLA